MTSEGKIASAVGGKTARACDSCLVKRARWYCAADDAFLCQGCDGSVHSANSLARRHERVRLKTASLKPTIESSIPSWHQGFTRKARTTRHGNKSTMKPPKTEEPMPVNPLPLVPEMGSDEASPNENEDQLLYRVPIFDPLVAELCTTASNEAIETNTTTSATTAALEGESKSFLPIDVENLPGFLPSDMDLEEFAADVESLLGRGLDEDTFGMEELGLLNTKQEETTMETMECEFGNGRVKVEEEEVDDPDADGFEMGRETLDLNFDCDSPTTAEDVEEEKVGAGGVAHGAVSAMMMKINDGYNLKLDYEAVIAAWASQGSPWTTGDKFHFNPDDWWPDCSTTCSMGVHHHLPYGDMGGGAVGGGQGVMGDGGREARVSRYREKRRTRLFSKKIRYEVRKLNAEKRPRMKGRFVKRASFAGSGYSF